jgi:hypothetical protein
VCQGLEEIGDGVQHGCWNSCGGGKQMMREESVAALMGCCVALVLVGSKLPRVVLPQIEPNQNA